MMIIIYIFYVEKHMILIWIHTLYF